MNIYIQTLLIALILNIVFLIIAYSRKTDKFTDFTYGATFIIIAIYSLVRTGSRPLVSILLLWLVLLWAARLTSYLVYRIRTIKRDKRFDGIRENFRRFANFWIGQAVSAWIILLPTIYFFNHPGVKFTPLMAAGLAVWLLGFYFESVADMQKFTFIQNPKNKGKWIEAGLWKRSRHPNYFGEISMWLGIYLFCLPVMSLPAALACFASPLLIFVLLRFVSGIPILEKQAEAKWGKDKDYQQYRKATPLLIPKL